MLIAVYVRFQVTHFYHFCGAGRGYRMPGSWKCTHRAPITPRMSAAERFRVHAAQLLFPSHYKIVGTGNDSLRRWDVLSLKSPVRCCSSAPVLFQNSWTVSSFRTSMHQSSDLCPILCHQKALCQPAKAVPCTLSSSSLLSPISLFFKPS